MTRNFVIAAAVAAVVSACASGPYDGNAYRRAGDQVVGRPDSAKVAALMRVADATAVAGDYGNAVAMYREAHNAEPDNVKVLEGLGRLLMRVGDNAEASRLYKRAIALSGDATAHEGLGKALIALDQPEAAITQLKAALAMKQQPGIYNALGVASDLTGDHAAAQAYYRTGLDADPGNLNLMNNLGLSLAVSGHHDEAIRLLREAAANSRATARNRLNLALAYGLAGETEAAAETARIDLDERSVQQNLAFYETLRALKDTRLTMRAIGAHNAALGRRLGNGAAKQTSRR